jgi:hypothetical protein
MAYPVSMNSGGRVSPFLVDIGDIHCTSDEVITPVGRRPIRSVSWEFQDLTRTVRSTPVWAVLLAIFGALSTPIAFALLMPLAFVSLSSLLFLIAKQDRKVGFVVVRVHGHGLDHVLQLPVSSPQQIAELGARVNYAHRLSDLY